MLVSDISDIIFLADFEDVEVPSGSFQHINSVSGFTASNEPVEVQHDVPGVGPAASSDQLLELDGTNSVSVTLNDRVNDGLMLRFDFSPRPGVSTQQNTIEIWYDGELLNEVTGDGRRISSTNFSSYAFGLPAVSGDSATLEFRSNSPADDVGLGGLIDNVQVLAASSIPALNPIEDQELAIGESLTTTASLDATTSETVTYSIVNGPVGLTIDSQTGEISWIANQADVDLSNADNSFQNFGDPEQNFEAGFEFADLPTGSYGFFTELDGFQSINPNVGVEVQNNPASVGPASEGQHHLELDGTAGVFRDVDTSDGGRFQLELDFSPRPGISPELNDIQVWWDGELVETIVGDGQELESTAFTTRRINLPVSSSDSTRLELRSNAPEDTVGLGGLVDNIILNQAALTEASGEDNKFQVIVQATIGSQTTFTDFLICVTEPSENQQPAFVAVDRQQVDEETELSLSLSATDLDVGDTLEYSITSGPAGATVDPANGLFSWTPGEVDGPGTESVSVRVVDGNGGSDELTFEVDVVEVNREPVLQSIANRTVEVDGSVEFVVVATDSDLPANTLSYSLTGDIPSGATIDSDSGQFVWSSIAVEAGSYPLTVVVTDGVGGSASQEFTIEVGDCPFHDSLAGWIATENGGTVDGHGVVSAVDCVASLVEGDSFETTLSTTFVVPDSATILSFEYDNLTFDSSDTSFINDAFEVGLVNSDGGSLVDTFADDRDAFFNITEGLPAALGDGVTISDTMVTVDVSDLLVGEVATLIFRLTNNDSDSATAVEIVDYSIPGFGTGPTTSDSKFFVADSAIDSVLTYDDNGQSQRSFLASPGNQQSHGVASNSDGSRLWTVDNATGQVTVYGGNGVRLGEWTATGVSGTEGIATDGTDIWIVDSGGEVHQFVEASNFGTEALANGELVPTFSPTSSFSLDASNASPSGITTDGDLLWVVDDAVNSVFVYSSAGALLGSWQLDSRNTDPSGVTNDANGGSSLWVVDRSGTVFHYVNAIDQLSGSLTSTDTFTLDSRNSSPEGIADPDEGETNEQLEDTPTKLVLTTTVRDLSGSHSDFESGFGGFVTELVEPQLGNDRTPVFAGPEGRGGIASQDSFFQWYHDVPGINETTNLPLTFSETEAGSGIFSFTANGFFPIDDQLLGNEGRSHNYHFTLALNSQFTYQGGEVFSFTGDDDVWVFINDQLVVDLGGVHGAITGSVALDDLGLTVGEDYPFDFFFAERQTVGSNFSATTTLLLEDRNELQPPTIVAEVPNTEIAAGTALLASGLATADGTLSDGTANSIEMVTIGGSPVDVLDRGGRFFSQLDVLPGLNQFEFEATDLAGQKISTTLEVFGTTATADFDLNQFLDVTGSFSGIYGRTSFDQQAEMLFVDLAMRNDGTLATEIPLYVGVTNISDPLVELMDADGMNEAGVSFYDFSSCVTNGQLEPGETSDSRTIRFHNPGRVQFDYELEFYTTLNRAPEITSLPEVEALAGQLYEYDVDAIDRDDDTLTYSLLLAPQGVTIDSATGVISWEPETSDIGNYDIAIQVEDGRGGSAEQRIVLSVIAPLNFSPVIISEPVTDVEIGATIEGESEQVDLSNWDVIQYDFGDGPASWELEAENAVVRQTRNSDASIFLSDFVLSNDRIEGTWEVVTTNDDDLMGFVFGYQDSEHYYLFDWKQTTQSDNTLGVAEQGMSVKLISADSPLIGGDLWSTNGDSDRVQTLFHDSSNPIGWEDLTEYGFSLDFRFGGFAITVTEGDQVIRTIEIDDSTYTDGRFGFYNYSQGSVLYSGFTRQTLAKAQYQYDVNAIDADGDTLEYSLFESPSGMRIDSQTGLILWNPTADQIGNHDVTIRVEDGRGGVAEQSFIVVFNDVENSAPVIVSTPVLDFIPAGVNNLATGQVSPAQILTNEVVPLVEQTVSFTLPEGGEQIGIPITVVTSSESVGLVNLTGVRNDIVSGEIVSFDVEFSGSESARFDLVFINADTNEALGSIPVTLNDAYQYDVNALDADGDVLSYSLEQGPDGATIDAATGEFGWTPDPSQTPGLYDVVVVVTDGAGGTDTQTFLIQVSQGNLPPTLAAIEDQTIDEDAELSVTATATDPDTPSQMILFSLSVSPSRASINPETGEIAWTPTEEDGPGTYDFTVVATDSAGATDAKTFQVVVAEVNQSPVIATIEDQQALIGQTIQLTVAATDADTPVNTLVYAIDSGPSGAAINSETGEFTWIPNTSQVPGVFNLVVSVSDGAGGTDTESFQVTVNQDNTPPVLAGIPDQTVEQASLLQFTVEAMDVDLPANMLTFGLSGTIPEGMLIDSSTGVVSWTTSVATAIGDYEVIVTVSDGNGGSDMSSVKITVLVASQPNRLPVITSTPDFFATVDTTYSYQIIAEDLDGDELTYSLLSGEDGITVDAETGLLQWTPAQPLTSVRQL